MNLNQLLSEEQIDSIQNLWFNSSHPKNNPAGYYDASKHNENINNDYLQDERIKDLIKLLKTIYTSLCNDSKIDFYLSGKSESIIAFEKYISNEIVANFPFISSNTIDVESHLCNEEKTFSEWVRKKLLTNDKRVQWIPPKIEYPTLENKSTTELLIKFCRIRYERLLPLARVCYLIDCFQFEDYKNNMIKIDNKGNFHGNVSGLKYGDKHILSAYLGQFIIRKFPFKDYNKFRSQKWTREGKSIYEHFTPISFFRDIIWVKSSSNNEEFLFDYKSNNHRVYNIEEWLSILWYRYRTIYIHEEEDKLLNKKNKTKRPGGEEGYTNIQIHDSMNQIWKQIHSIDMLKTVAK